MRASRLLEIEECFDDILVASWRSHSTTMGCNELFAETDWLRRVGIFLQD